MLRNGGETIADEYVPQDTEEIVSDLLYTLFLTMDEYVTYLGAHDQSVDELTKMKNYVEKEMQKYVKILYQVDMDI